MQEFHGLWDLEPLVDIVFFGHNGDSLVLRTTRSVVNGDTELTVHRRHSVSFSLATLECSQEQ